MNRRHFFLLGATAALAAHAPLRAQGQRLARIGILANYSPATAAAAPLWAPFYAELASRGWVEGRSLAVEGRYAQGDPDRDAAHADELVAARVELIVATGSGAVAAARKATSTVPIVMVNVSHAVETGFVTSLARPGGNVTGVTNQAGDMQGKFLELLRWVRPEVRQVGVIWSPDNVGSALAFKDVQAVARSVGVTMLSLPANHATDIEPLLAIAQRAGVQALIAHPTHAVVATWRQIQAWASITRWSRWARRPGYGVAF